MTSREDLETAVLLLVGKAAARALAKEKNRRKPPPTWTHSECIDALSEEVDEVYNAETDEEFIDELGDVIACAGLALWRAHGGGGE